MALLRLDDARIIDFVAHLQARKKVYAPHAKGRASYVFAPVEQPQDVVLDYPRTLHSVKKYFMPPREALLDFNLIENTFTPPALEPVNAVFLGVHAYDMHAVLKADYNFSRGHPEKNYLARRQEAVFVGVTFTPDLYHFSGSVGIGPDDTTGFDVFLHRVEGGYAVELLTDAGRRLLDGFPLPGCTDRLVAGGHFHQHIYVPQGKLFEVFEHGYHNEVWEEVAARCTGCGTCNLVCPTCVCFNVEDRVDVTVTRGTRERYWDSCLLRGFGEVAGGEVFREHLAGRQRHRVYRKFKYISDLTGEPWCVGCGRCTAHCTAGISIVDIVNRLVNDYDKQRTATV
ncbi:4Fe-4S dicluster domain-containing protein [bacterium]|nr:4Fe-4S dicluster domain-containing protein [bacterium]MBU1073404.1 4Fe-4S dicluster domain-containing protein [bacterium]MBU1676463.1 4Fe-4S dicluster domain-containing protein [bacterium]